MDSKEAKELLLIHSFIHEEPFPPKMETGFLGSLRPYSGLNQENYDEVIAALKVLAPEI